MTIEELFIKLGELSESAVLWFISGFETLQNGDWLQLTIGQGVFTIFAGVSALVYIIGLWQQQMNTKAPDRKPGSDGWSDH